ncbi:MAG: right-handed parallel beta-helix repeat-containing protein [Clostridia bacterium]|nr:right-handed parallel beta-helix repeat-containing protein [Clostridia bacterium]
MQTKKLCSLLLVCAMVFALMLTGCNTAVDTNTDETICTCTCTCATAGDNLGGNDDGWNDGWDDGNNDGGNTPAASQNNRPNASQNYNPRPNASQNYNPRPNGTQGNNNNNNNNNNTPPAATQGNNNTPAATQGKNTTTTKKVSGAQTVYNTPQLPSFTRNDDGTYTDRETGVVFIDDDCNAFVSFDEDGNRVNNGTKLYASSGVGVDGNQKEFFANDSGRYIRYPSDASSWWFSYELKSGINEIAIEAFTGKTSSGTMIDGFDIYVSNSPNSGWVKKNLSYNTGADTDIGSGWYLRTYTAKNLGGYKYLKVQYKSIPSGTEFYVPNIARVRINNIGKMSETSRYLEGRVSKTFYVDYKSGNDNNDGTSEATAWKSLGKVSSHYYQPGDKILFKSGCRFPGTLTINGFGTSSDRLTISTYGGSARAIIEGRNGPETVVRASIEYATVENLEIFGKTAQNGLQIGAGHTGANKGIIIQNCYIHDINTSDERFEYKNAGINFNSSGTEPTWFEGLLVRNNIIKNVARVGIYMTGAWGDRPGVSWGASGSLYKSDTNGWWPNTNCSISNNQLLDIHGDAILVITGKNITIEKNFVNNAFCVPTSKYDYIDSNGWNTAAAAVWVCNTNNAVMQYNDVGYTNLPTNFGDGEGFDIDGANKNCTVQYNFSHNNAGGFLLMCEFPESLSFTRNSSHFVRFNLSLNDAQAGHGVFVATATEAQMNIYNNTIIQVSSNAHLFTNWDTIKNMLFQNNIFYGTAAGTFNSSMSASCSNIRFDNNVFWGGSGNVSKSGVSMTNKKSQDPKFKNDNFSAPKQETSKMSDALNAFTPTSKINGATNISNNGGKDIKGSSFSSINFYGCVKH